MKLAQLSLRNFQCFGPDTTTINFEDATFFIGPNGAGKTAVLHALARMFGVSRTLREVRRSDFHACDGAEVLQLSLEARFEFSELGKPGKHTAVAPHFKHMWLSQADGPCIAVIRLDATLHADGEIEETLQWVMDDGATQVLDRADRNLIQVHYLPARRDPSDHISYAANSLLGRVLRAADWSASKAALKELGGKLTEMMQTNPGLSGLNSLISAKWQSVHKGNFFADPKFAFAHESIEGVLRNLTVSFSPGHGADVDFTRLSDGQQSLLYLSLVLSVHDLDSKVVANELPGFAREKLNPPAFTMIAMEEPENSLSPHYLGRVTAALQAFAEQESAQVCISTHAPSLLRRIETTKIRYLRLNEERVTEVKTIHLPPDSDDAHKFVREAVLAFPELYFSRLVILGEGASEELVLRAALAAKGLQEDDASIVVAPLGGRHVNHFWRLLDGLGIPYFTLLDLDSGRFGGGWGRFKTMARQRLALGKPSPNYDAESKIDRLPEWNAPTGANREPWLVGLRTVGVFFSAPLDLDFMLLRARPDAYGVDDSELTAPSADEVSLVLGKKHAPEGEHYDSKELEFFRAYAERFKRGSKPSAHLDALAHKSYFKTPLPEPLEALIAAVKAQLAKLPE